MIIEKFAGNADFSRKLRTAESFYKGQKTNPEIQQHGSNISSATDLCLLACRDTFSGIFSPSFSVCACKSPSLNFLTEVCAAPLITREKRSVSETH